MKDNSYSNIFKTTFLFGFVQIFNVVVKVGTNKVVALLLGAEGMGIISLLNTTVNLLKTGAGLGVSQSAVRDISEACQSQDYSRLSSTISITHKIILFTSLLGILITLLLSPYLSHCNFGNYGYTATFMLLSLMVGMNVLTEGQLSILTGMRRLRQLALASMIGAVVGLLSAIPFYYIWGKDGIVPSLLVTAFSALFFSSYFVRKVKYEKIQFSFNEFKMRATPIVKMGVALMLVTFLGFMFDLIVSAYIRSTGGLDEVGYYQAGVTIIGGYFGVIITAMSTDYYPRISAVHSDNSKLSTELNKQAETGLILIFPLVILFVFITPFLVRFLYSDKFLVSSNYTDYAIFGTIIIIVSNCMGMILLAKQAAKIFILSVLLQRTLLIVVYIYAYRNWGLSGLGYSYVMTGVIHIGIMILILKHRYNITLNSNVYRMLILVICMTIITFLIRQIDMVWLKYSAGIVSFLFCSLYSYKYVKDKMNIDICQAFIDKIKKK